MSIEKAYPLGKTAASGEAEHLLGQLGCFKHKDPDATSSLKRVLSEINIEARWVKNESGGALTPGFIVPWDTGATYGPFKAVGGVAISGTTFGVGVVDPFLPTAGVANDLHFWLITFGPCQFRFTTGTTIAVGDVMALGGAGRVTKYNATTVTIQGNFDRCGRCLEAVDTAIASDTLFDGFADFRA